MSCDLTLDFRLTPISAVQIGFGNNPFCLPSWHQCHSLPPFLSLFNSNLDHKSKASVICRPTVTGKSNVPHLTLCDHIHLFRCVHDVYGVSRKQVLRSYTDKEKCTCGPRRCASTDGSRHIARRQYCSKQTV